MFDPAQDLLTASDAPGHPGTAPTWSGGAKDAVGCALGPARLWYTVGQGIVNEVYWPRADIPQIRDLGFIVADGHGLWVEVRSLGQYQVVVSDPGVPVTEVLHRHERFTLRLRVCPDPKRDVLLVEVDLEGEPGLRAYALLAPRLGASGTDNRAWVGTHRGRRVLWAEQGPFALALAASAGGHSGALGRASVGYAGTSDGWQDFSLNGAMTWTYERAGPGNVALMAEVPPSSMLALGFAASKESAATLAGTALEQTFAEAAAALTAQWRAWHAHCEAQRAFPPLLPASLQASFSASATVLRAHLDRTFPGAMVASLSIPWGTSRGERDAYHLVRIRDLSECASALLAVGALDEARDILRYLIATQDPDGHWAGAHWLGGRAVPARARPADAAYPVLLAAALSERGALEGTEAQDMVARALGHLVRQLPGPLGPDARMRSVDAPALAAGIAGLVTGARFLGSRARGFALAVADYWNANLEAWTAYRNTPLCERLGVSACYGTCPSEAGGAPWEGVGADFLAVVRLGVRRPDDPVVLDSLRVLDALLRVQTPNGPAWRRHVGDAYGEYPDGRPFDGGGRGHPWPLLTGERGHYEVACGRDPLRYLEAMAAMAGPSGLIPEQVWDGPPLPALGLAPGAPTGSAMPLAWAHAEFLKLAVSRGIGRPVDRPAAVWRRYQSRRRPAATAIWTPHAPIATIEAGQRLLVCTSAPARVHFGVDRWRSVADAEASPTGLGLYAAEVATGALGTGRSVEFTLQWRDSGRWCGQDFAIRVRAPATSPVDPEGGASGPPAPGSARTS